VGGGKARAPARGALAIKSLGGTDISRGTCLEISVYNADTGERLKTLTIDSGGSYDRSTQNPTPENVELHQQTHMHFDHYGNIPRLLERNEKTLSTVLLSEDSLTLFPLAVKNSEYIRKREGSKQRAERAIAALRKKARVLGDGDTYSFDTLAGKCEITAYRQPKGMEHIPGALLFKDTFFSGTESQISLSTMFDIYAEVTGDAGIDARHFSQFRRLRDGEGAPTILVPEMTTAYKQFEERTNRESEEVFVEAVSDAIRKVNSSPNKGCVLLPCFAQKRAQDLVTLIPRAIERSGIPKEEITCYMETGLGKGFVGLEKSPYAGVFDEMVENFGSGGEAWSYTFPDGNLYVVAASPGFCHTGKSKEILDAIMTGNIRYGEGGAVVLNSTYAPENSPLREILEEGRYKGDAIPDGTVRAVSLSGHPNCGEAYLEAAKAVGADFIFPIHGSEKARRAYSALLKRAGYSDDKLIFPEPGGTLVAFSDSGRLRTKYADNSSDIPSIVRELAGS